MGQKWLTQGLELVEDEVVLECPLSTSLHLSHQSLRYSTFLQLSPTPSTQENHRFKASFGYRVQGHPGQLSELLSQNIK